MGMLELLPGSEVVWQRGLRFGESWTGVGDGESADPVYIVHAVAVEGVVVGAGVDQEALVARQPGERVLAARFGVLLEEAADVPLQALNHALKN